jgi:hypothetical protein
MTQIATATARDKVGEFEVAPTALTGADTLVYKPSVFQVLYLRNDAVTPVTVTIDGDGVSTIALPGQGKPVDNAAGYPITVLAGQTMGVTLNTIRNFLLGTVNVTGGTTDTHAWIVEG